MQRRTWCLRADIFVHIFTPDMNYADY